MGCAPVTFNYTLWTTQFPEFSALTEAQGQFYFDLATVIQRNDGRGPVSNPSTALNLLNLLTSFMATQYSQSMGDQSPGSAKPANTPVGRISDATEGSVTARTDYGATISQQQAYLIQNKYGATWWALTAQYRTARYVPGQLQSGAAYGAGGFPGYGGFR